MKRTAPRSTLRKIIKKHKPQLRLAANADLLVRKERGGGEARLRLPRGVLGSAPAFGHGGSCSCAGAPGTGGPKQGRSLPKCSELCALEHFGCDGMSKLLLVVLLQGPTGRGEAKLGETQTPGLSKKTQLSRGCRAPLCWCRYCRSLTVILGTQGRIDAWLLRHSMCTLMSEEFGVDTRRNSSLDYVAAGCRCLLFV